MRFFFFALSFSLTFAVFYLRFILHSEWRGGEGRGRVLWYGYWYFSRVLTDSASLCREAFMRSGLRGGGSGGSDAAIVGPAARPLICIPPLPPNNNTALLPLLYSVLCCVLGYREFTTLSTVHNTVRHTTIYNRQTHRETNEHTHTRSSHALQLPDILTTLQSNR